MKESQEKGETTLSSKDELRLQSTELENKIKELLAQKGEKKPVWFSSPLLLALVGLIGTAIGASVQGYWNNKLERQKFESSLIIKSLDTTDQKKAADNLKFLVNAGLITNLNIEKIDKLAEEQKLPLRLGTDPFGEKVSWQKLNDTPFSIKLGEDYEKKNIVYVTIPQLKNIPGGPKDGRILFHRIAAQPLKEAFAEIEKRGLLNLILSWDAGYQPRLIRSGTHISDHAFGAAFDINANYNRVGTEPPPKGSKGSVRELVPIFKKHGFQWGGDFKGSPDGMHFLYISQQAKG